MRSARRESQNGNRREEIVVQADEFLKYMHFFFDPRQEIKARRNFTHVEYNAHLKQSDF